MLILLHQKFPAIWLIGLEQWYFCSKPINQIAGNFWCSSISIRIPCQICNLFYLPLSIGHFRVFPVPLYQNEVKCSAFDMQMIFHSRANKTHFHKKGFALGLILKLRVLELWSGLLRCDAFVFTWWMILDYYYYAFVERANLRLAWLWVDPIILNCADKISNQNGFGTVHLLLLNVQWDLDWELRILWQDWPLKSTQIG